MQNQEVELLLLEDNPSDAELTLRALKKNRIVNNIVHLKDGAEGLDFIFGTGAYAGRDTNKTPKVILLDVKMPRVSGIEVLRKLKGDERTKRIPVVMLTSSREDPDVRECYRLGANSYIVKPVEFDSFMKEISDLGLYWLLLNTAPN